MYVEYRRVMGVKLIGGGQRKIVGVLSYSLASHTSDDLNNPLCRKKEKEKEK
jgi:hypothetical protein